MQHSYLFPLARTRRISPGDEADITLTASFICNSRSCETRVKIAFHTYFR